MPLAAPVIKTPFTRRTSSSPWAMTIPTVPTRQVGLRRAAPQRVEPQRLEHPHATLHVSVVAQESRVAGQHLRGGDRQRAHQRRDVVADGVGGAGSQLVFDDADDLLDHAFDLLVEQVADLGVGVARGVACRHHRVVVGIDRRGTSDHPLGERRRRFVRPAGCEVLGQLLEFVCCVGEDLRQHRVLGVEVEVEPGSGHPRAIADGAHRQLRERFLLEQLAHRLHDGLALPVAPSPRNRHDRGWSAARSAPCSMRTPRPCTTPHPKRKLDSRQVSHRRMADGDVCHKADPPSPHAPRRSVTSVKGDHQHPAIPARSGQAPADPVDQQLPRHGPDRTNGC